MRLAIGFLAFCLLLSGRCFAAGPLADEPLVDLHKVDPTIAIELRYATANNFTGAPLYPSGTKCLVRQSVAQRLRYAQYLLRQHGFGLKIWDAYRPREAHRLLWKKMSKPGYVGDPARGGSLHSWGIAVDATLVDRRGRAVPMPTDFDNFTDAAALRYTGTDPTIRANLHLLQGAIAAAGFLGMRTEWWHFIPRNWTLYSPRNLPASRFAPDELN